MRRRKINEIFPSSHFIEKDSKKNLHLNINKRILFHINSRNLF